MFFARLGHTIIFFFHSSPHKELGFLLNLKSKVTAMKDIFPSDLSIASFWSWGNLFRSFQELVSHCQGCPVENKYIQSYVYMVVQYNQRSTCIACLFEWCLDFEDRSIFLSLF